MANLGVALVTVIWKSLFLDLLPCGSEAEH
jgi:hypothetical protein